MFGLTKKDKEIKATACALSNVGTFSLGSGRAYTVEVIKWHLADYTPDMDQSKILKAFTEAFELWAELLDPIKIESVSNKNEANIVINFANNGDRDLPIPFDDSTLAYAYFPVRNKSDMWFNDAYNWGEMHTSSDTNLKKVATHEIGHSLNIGHTNASGDIMLPTYTPNNTIRLTQDTKNAVERLYGPLKKRIRDRQERENTPVDDIPENELDLTILKILFPTKWPLYRLASFQLIGLARHLGIRESNRRRLIDKIYRLINR